MMTLTTAAGGQEQNQNRTREAKNTNKEAWGEVCYLLFTAIFCVLKALGFYEGQAAFNAGMVAAFLLLGVGLLLNRKSGIQWAAVLVLLGMGALVYYNTGEKSFLVNLAFLAGFPAANTVRKKVPSPREGAAAESKKGNASHAAAMIFPGAPAGGDYDREEKRVMKVGLTCWGIGYCLLTLLSLLGLHGDKLYMHDKHGIGFVLCHSLGYAHSNVLHINYICICAMIFFLARDVLSKRQKVALTAVLAVLDLYVFLYSVSFTGLIASILFYCLYLYGVLRGRLSRGEGVLAQLILPVCVVFSLVGPLVVRGRLFDLINQALNTRYNLTRWFLTTQPITPFGTRIDIDNFRYTLDCSYAYLFVRLGVVPFALLMALYLLAIHRMVKEQRLTELAILLGLCIAGVTEPFLFNLSFKNVSLLFVAEELWRDIRWLEEKVRRNSSGQAREENGAQPQRSLLSEKVMRGMGRISLEWFRHGKRYLVTALLAAAVASGICLLATKPAEVVYINGSVNEVAERPYVFLSEEEAQEARQDGAILYGYTGPAEKMYPYAGTTARIEYARIVASWGIWTAGAVCVAEAFLQGRRRHPLR